MFPTCDACGRQERWHPQLHLVTPLSSGCVDEELVALLDALSDLRISVLRSCQDELHSGRVALLLSSGDAQRFLDEVVRTAPEELRLRLLEASCPPRIEDREWSVAAALQASFGQWPRVLSLDVQVDFPRSDLSTVVGCLSGELGTVPGVGAAHPGPQAEADLFALLQDRISEVLELADEEAFAVLRLDQLDDEALRALVGSERWDVPSPGFYPGLRTLRPPLTTWLALRATVTALDLWDVDRDEADLEFHLEAARLAQRWCARSYQLLTGDDIDDLPELEEWEPARRSGYPRHPRPTYHGRGVGRELDKETASPLELDERAVLKLLVQGAVAALDHEDVLNLMGEVGEYPRGDPRRPVVEDEQPAPRPAWASVADVVRDGIVEVTSGDAVVAVPVGNLRVLMESAREVCALPAGVAYACAISYELSGRPSRVTFVPCRQEWTQIRASALRPGDLLHEDVDYPYVVGEVVFSDDGHDVAVERSGRGWLSLSSSALVKAQRGRARPITPPTDR